MTEVMIRKIKDRMLGCLYGQAIGDALGLGSEFMSKDEVGKSYLDGLKRYDQIIQDAHRRCWKRGAWTDDTDMMLCIMSAFEDGRFNMQRVARNFKDWFKGDPMGIGSHTYKVLCMGDYVAQPEVCSKLWWDLSGCESAANGALMRTSVVGLAPCDVEKQAVDVCKLTHYDPRCVGTCVIASLIIHELVWNDRELTQEDMKALGEKYDERIEEWIDLAFQNEDISALDLDEPASIGYTLRTFAGALWSLRHSDSFEEGLLAIVNEGGDADTNGAVAGAILGAKFGYSSIPEYYKSNLYDGASYQDKINAFLEKILIER